jgi:hypothetical protein
MEKHGRITFRSLSKNDRDAVEEFCNSQNYSNNTSLEKMKWDWCPFWCAAFDGDKIVSIAGAHELPEVSPNAYRLLFRGAQLPGYTLGVGRNIFKTGIHLSYLLPLQITWATRQNPNAELYITTNINNDGGKSKRMNDTMMPLLAKTGIWSLEQSMMLYYVPQRVWRINVDRYTEERNRWLGNDNYILQK